MKSQEPLERWIVHFVQSKRPSFSCFFFRWLTGCFFLANLGNIDSHRSLVMECWLLEHSQCLDCIFSWDIFWCKTAVASNFLFMPWVLEHSGRKCQLCGHPISIERFWSNAFDWTQTLLIKLKRLQMNSNALKWTRTLSNELERFRMNSNAFKWTRTLSNELECFWANSNAFDRTLLIHIGCPNNWQFLPLCGGRELERRRIEKVSFHLDPEWNITHSLLSGRHGALAINGKWMRIFTWTHEESWVCSSSV